LFLDEIGDISARTQVALLRVLEERKIERVGGSTAIPVDVRIVCATHRDLRALVERGEFREDLFYRLSGITLHVPPLRERISDVPLLCPSLLGRIAVERGEPERSLAESALGLLMRHHWPGNVRELENVLRAASLFAEGTLIEEHDLIEHVEALRRLHAEPYSQPGAPHHERDGARADSPSMRAAALGSDVRASEGPLDGVAYREIRESGVSLSSLKRRVERECIARALREADGNITRAAAMLGMKRPRLSQLVKQYRLAGAASSEQEP
jgi:DNA-binding NtrC family response regulator